MNTALIDNQTEGTSVVAEQRVVGMHGCGSFLKAALGIYITPLPILDAIEGREPFQPKFLYENPPRPTVQSNVQSSGTAAERDGEWNYDKQIS